jgi:hypothetical protein
MGKIREKKGKPARIANLFFIFICYGGEAKTAFYTVIDDCFYVNGAFSAIL